MHKYIFFQESRNAPYLLSSQRSESYLIYTKAVKVRKPLRLLALGRVKALLSELPRWQTQQGQGAH